MSQFVLTHALRHLPPWLIFDVRHADKILREKRLADEALVHDMPTERDFQAVRFLGIQVGLDP